MKELYKDKKLLTTKKYQFLRFYSFSDSPNKRFNVSEGLILMTRPLPNPNKKRWSETFFNKNNFNYWLFANPPGAKL